MMKNTKKMFLRFTSGAMFLPCALAVEYHWSIWVGVPLIAIFGILNFADGLERGKGK